MAKSDGMNQFKILGCSGSIGKNGYTTCFQINHDLLIDAGSGLFDEEPEALKKIDKIFVTHSHLDHILGIPLLADLSGFYREKPIEIFAHPTTIDVLRNHIFNNSIWPDFTQIPEKQNPYLKLKGIDPHEDYLHDGLKITPFEVNHTVPCFGYKIESDKHGIIFSGDTGPSDRLIEVINESTNLKAVIIDVSFENERKKIAELSKHFSPTSLLTALNQINTPQNIYITHQKPGSEKIILDEIAQTKTNHRIQYLKKNTIIQF